MKVIISGGGTGGHIFPALSIANAIKAKHPDAEILFVGAENRMEMEKVPAAGYKIIGLPVAGFDRKNLLKNISVLLKLYKSITKARKIIRDFKPDIAIGVGGYASGPTLKAAAQKGIPTLLQEQNSYAGVTNKLLAKKAAKICVSYDGMDKFFPKEKIILTGNPVRQDLKKIENGELRIENEAYEYFGLDAAKKTILIIGGSLGARTINESVLAHLKDIENSDVQVIWQTGKNYYQAIACSDKVLPCSDYSDRLEPVKIARREVEPRTNVESHTNRQSSIHVMEFVSRMDLAYSVADLVISRAGASSISELCLLGKATILVPSPNVAEDHQTKNAMALVKHDAAIMIADKDAVQELISTALKVVQDEEKLKSLSANILKLALPDAADKIVDEIEKILRKND
jgi:UDP-N-acetylglucosamine--N-acetylmuramyl-(pentapeptide) pyrophosphoryl-undecaprenol N-acetylglucosamine transferase